MINVQSAANISFAGASGSDRYRVRRGFSIAAEILNKFRPSTIRTEYGVPSEVEFSSGLVEVESGALAHHLPQAMKEFSFAEPVWVIGYKTDILDSRARAHVQLSVSHVL